jgi:hypothetical protein
MRIMEIGMTMRGARIAAGDAMTGMESAAADVIMMRRLTTAGGEAVLASSGAPKINLAKVAAKAGAGDAGEAIDREKF